MKTLKNYIIEAVTPKFANNKEGIISFCEYVFNPKFVKYIVNSDLTITLESNTPSDILNMDTKDLTEIPDFIVFSNIEKYHLGLGYDCRKLKHWAPKVNGYCSGFVVDDNPKIQTLDFSNCEIKGGKLFIQKTAVKSIIGPKGEDVQIYIKQNKNLDELDLKQIKSCMDPGSYIFNNKRLEIDLSKLPKGIYIENNKLKEKHYKS